MVKKNSSQQSSNGVVVADSSESDESKNLDKLQNATKHCAHLTKAVTQNLVKRNLNLEDIDNNNFCVQCSKQGLTASAEDVYVCLRCGSKSCSIAHSKEHTDTPRSDPHSLSFNLLNKTVWCHDCGTEIDVSSNKKLKACVNIIETMYRKHQNVGPTLKSSTPEAPPKDIEPITEESTEDSSLIAVPFLPPKAKTNTPVGVKGLWNLGNTCFFNSVLQCLAQTPNLIETLRGMQDNLEVSIEVKDGRTLSGSLEKQDPFGEELADTLYNIRGAGSPFTPQKILNMLRKKVSQFRGNDQHDSHELLRHLLDTVRCSDLKRYRKIIINHLGLNGIENHKVDPEKQKELKQLDREVNEKVMLVPDQVFRGFLVSRLECQECHHSSECVESFLDLSLPVTSEKPHPPATIRRKGCQTGLEEKPVAPQLSKHQLKKERKLERKKSRGKHHGQQNKKPESGQGESMNPILEKGESDAEGDDGDVDSEESDKKTETGTDFYSRGGEMICAGVSSPSGELLSGVIENQRLKDKDFLSSRDVTSRSAIPLTADGIPDLSRLALSEEVHPELKTFVRDTETISREDPSWLSHLQDYPEPPENGNSPASNHVSSSPDSKASVNVSPPPKLDKSEKEGEISSDDKTIVGESSGEGNPMANVSHWLSSQILIESGWEESTPAASSGTPVGHSPSPTGPLPGTTSPTSPHPGTTSPTKATPEPNNSDDEVMVGSFFEENSALDTSAECTIQSCLSQFTQIELMTGSNKVGCETCTQRANKSETGGKTVYTMSTKQLLISEAPPVLILHIKRFQVQMSSFRKLSRHVAFPLELDISPFCKAETVKNSPRKLLYSLYGIVEHSGNFSGGHYVAYVRVENRWFCISDSYVNEVPQSRVLRAQAYLLFYKSS